MNRRPPAVIMVASSEPERVHLALKTAMLTVSAGRPVMVFFTKLAVLSLVAGREDSARDAMDARLADLGQADTSTLLEALNAMPAVLAVCEDSLAEHGIDRLSLISGPDFDITSLASFMENARGGDWITF